MQVLHASDLLPGHGKIVRMRILLMALFVGMVAIALWAWVAAPGERRLGSLMADADTEADIGWLAVAGAALLVFLLVMEIVSVRRLIR